jgi:hypothetical protein
MRLWYSKKQIIINHHLALWETVIYLDFMDERGRLKISSWNEKSRIEVFVCTPSSYSLSCACVWNHLSHHLIVFFFSFLFFFFPSSVVNYISPLSFKQDKGQLSLSTSDRWNCVYFSYMPNPPSSTLKLTPFFVFFFFLVLKENVCDRVYFKKI